MPPLSAVPIPLLGWLTPKPDPQFEAKYAEVCAVYLDAPAAAREDVRSLSVDEMTGVQALERGAPRLDYAAE